MTREVTARFVRSALLARQELALLDLRSEAQFATGHPLFAAQLGADALAVEAPLRLPRRDVQVVLYDAGEGLVGPATAALRELGFSEVSALAGGLEGWRAAGYELFEDVNSFSKAFGELVEARRHTPSVSAEELQAGLARGDDLRVLDARRYDEYATMSIPTSTSVPGAELALRARLLAPDPRTTIVVNCAGRTRSIIGAQSLINAGLPNRVVALRNGTIGWTLAGQTLEQGQSRTAPSVERAQASEARKRTREVAFRAGVRHIDWTDLTFLVSDTKRTLYRFDVRTPEEHAAGHWPGFRSAPGGQLVQELDMFAPVRGARVVLADDLVARADMSASWLAQLGVEVYVLEDSLTGTREIGHLPGLAPRPRTGRYKRPYEGTDNPRAAMQAYLEWEYGLVGQLERDGTHGFYVI